MECPSPWRTQKERVHLLEVLVNIKVEEQEEERSEANLNVSVHHVQRYVDERWILESSCPECV